MNSIQIKFYVNISKNKFDIYKRRDVTWKLNN